MTAWHNSKDLPPMSMPELEILYWDGCYMCRVFGTYDHAEKDWYVCGEPLIDEDTPDWEVKYWA